MQNTNVRISKALDPCTVKLCSPWKWGSHEGKDVRIVTLTLPTLDKSKVDVTTHFNELIKDKLARIISPYYVETGPTLVAHMTIEGVDLETVFSDRHVPAPPTKRAMDPRDYRRIRRVKGLISKKWSNPLSLTPSSQRPSLCNLSFPTDTWLPGYDQALARVDKVFCTERLDLNKDVVALRSFLEMRNEKTFILFGHCGNGKSWFVRNYLRKHPPENTDVGFIDASDYPHDDGFVKRLNLRLDELLTRFLKSRKGGLVAALKPYLENHSQGHFPNVAFEDPQVQAWCAKRLNDLDTPQTPEAFNIIRLESYSYSGRSLLLVVDNIDGFSKERQADLLDQIISVVTLNERVFLIVPMRPSSEFFYARLSRSLQHLLKGHHLSAISLNPMIHRRLTISETGEDINSYRPDGKVSMLDILNKYINSTAAEIIANLTQSDIRQYIRLIRRLISSDDLEGFHNLGSANRCVAALMLRPGERFSDDESFLVNCFDNDRPDEIGNALIRWRVLEYFDLDYHDCTGDFFEYYFARLGYDLGRVNEVLRMWAVAGAVELDSTKGALQGTITDCGRQYRYVISKLWYCIAVKTGMNIDTAYILEGESAKTAAAEYEVNLTSEAEWVSDTGFLAFLADEEQLEECRVAEFPNKVMPFEDKCRVTGPRSIHQHLWYAYTHQQRDWSAARREGRDRN